MKTTLLYGAVLMLLCGLALNAQTFGDISGEVHDASGAAIPGALVTATNIATNVTRSAATNEVGLYSFPAMPPGVYNIKVEKAGFKSVTKTSIELQVQQSARIDFDMPVGQVNESVEVSATAQLLSTEDATVGTVIENKRIVELPLNGRNYLQLVSLAPNVSYGFGSAGQANSRQGGDRANQNIAVGGNRSYFNNFTLDGVDNTDPNFNTVRCTSSCATMRSMPTAMLSPPRWFPKIHSSGTSMVARSAVRCGFRSSGTARTGCFSWATSSLSVKGKAGSHYMICHRRQCAAGTSRNFSRGAL